MLYKYSRILTIGVALLSFSALKPADNPMRKHYFDVRDKNIGLDNNPVPASQGCLLSQAIIGSTTTIYRNAAVQPVVAVNPMNKKYVVAAFQEGRISNGGALDIGIATSKDGGKHFSDMIFPFQSCVGGINDRSSDVELSYGPDGKLYLVALVFNATKNPDTVNQSGVVTSVSSDNGLTWSIPQWLATSQDFLNEPTEAFSFNTTPSVSADPNNPGFANAVWSFSPVLASFHSDVAASSTTDGGVTWSQNYILYNPADDATFATINNGIANDMGVNSPMLVYLPNGDLLTFMVRIYAAPGTTDQQFTNDVWPFKFTLFDIAFVRSTDNGATWDTDATVVTSIDANETFTGGYTYGFGGITGGVGNQTRTADTGGYTYGFGGITGGVGNQTRTAEEFFSVAVNPDNGYLYVVFQSGQFANNQLPQIALVSSRDGGLTWSDAARVSRTSLNAPNPQAFTASVAVAEHGRVGILYQDFSKDNNAVPTKNASTKTNVWFAEYKETKNPLGGSTGIGLDFVHVLRVSKHSYIMQNGPEVDGGIMTNGDSNSLVAVGDDYFAAYVKSNNCPMLPDQTLIDNTTTSTILILNNNRITSPYFSRIDSK